MRCGTVVFDLDGTLSNCSHRADLARSKQWEEFHALASEDPVFQDTKELFTTLNDRFATIILTGRPEKYRKMTIEWLTKNDIFCDELLMRADGDFTTDYKMKLLKLQEFFGGKQEMLDEILFCFDDRDAVVAAFRDEGLPCYQVRQGDY